MGCSHLLSLVDFLAYKAGCEYVSDLHYIDNLTKLRLFRALEKVQPEDFTLWDWNDALDYLSKMPPQENAEKARKMLILTLVSSPA